MNYVNVFKLHLAVPLSLEFLKLPCLISWVALHYTIILYCYLWPIELPYPLGEVWGRESPCRGTVVIIVYVAGSQSAVPPFLPTYTRPAHRAICYKYQEETVQPCSHFA